MSQNTGEVVAHGAVTSQYSVIAKLGQGGMASVFLAVAQGAVADFHKLVVLKRLHDSLREDAAFVDMFVCEAKIAARLNHPNVVHTYSVDLQEGQPVLVMEYLDGVTFSVLQKRLAGRPFEERLVLIASVVDALVGLHYVHELTDYDGTSMGLVHRDVKPANIFVTFDGQTKVLDFGVAKATAPGQDQTNTQVLKGTARYMAPEAVGSASIDGRADVFSMGVMLWELASGRPLWEGAEDLQILRRLMDNDVPTLDSVGVDAPPELSRICAKAMQLDPHDRYSSADALRKDLAELVVDHGLTDVAGALRMVMELEFGHRREVRATSIRERLDGLKQASALDPHDMRTLPSAARSLPSGTSDVAAVLPAAANPDKTGSSRISLGIVVLAAAVMLCVGGLGAWWLLSDTGEPESRALPVVGTVPPINATPLSPPVPETPVVGTRLAVQPSEREVVDKPGGESNVELKLDVAPVSAPHSPEADASPIRRPRTKRRPHGSANNPKAEAVPGLPSDRADPPLQPGEMPIKKDHKTSGLSLDKDSPWGGRP